MAISRNEIKEKLASVIRMAMPSLALEADKIDESMALTTDMGLNSVGVLYVVIAVEEFFGIRFDDVGFADFHTVADVVDYIEKKLAQ